MEYFDLVNVFWSRIRMRTKVHKKLARQHEVREFCEEEKDKRNCTNLHFVIGNYNASFGFEWLSYNLYLTRFIHFKLKCS